MNFFKVADYILITVEWSVTLAAFTSWFLRARNLSQILKLNYNIKIDIDQQYGGFRVAMPFLLILIVLYVPLARFLRKNGSKMSKYPALNIILLSFPILAIMHNPRSALLILFLILPQYCITVLLVKLNLRSSSKLFKLLAYIYPMGSLLFLRTHPYFLLSTRNGWYPWVQSYNFATLRMISFAIDIIESNTYNVKILDYLAYMFYLPLYMAGPIITFDDWSNQMLNKNNKKDQISTNISIDEDSFIKQNNKKSKELEIKMVLNYGIILLFFILIMELYIRTIFPTYLARLVKYSGVKKFSAFDLLSISFICFAHIWLKLLIIWRFFRLWALLDGCNAPENMKGFLINNNSIIEFWRSWHISFNLWNVKYIYIPLGGRKTRMLNIWPIFAFVAIWHDMEKDQVIWAIIIAMGMFIEILISSKFSKFKSKFWYPIAVTLGYTILIAANTAGNIIGFSVGVNGGIIMFKRMLDFKFLSLTLLSLFFIVRWQLRYFKKK